MLNLGITTHTSNKSESLERIETKNKDQAEIPGQIEICNFLNK